MSDDRNNMIYVLHEGAVQEEAWEWSDIEEMCRSGRLSPETKIFSPSENCWKKILDTELASLFADATGGEQESPAAPGPSSELQQEYQDLLDEIESSPRDWNLCVQAAETAAAIGDRDAALRHFQDALDVRPYHPGIVQKARRNIAPAELGKLRFLEKANAFWEAPLEFLAYPLSRGPLYFLVPIAVLAALLWVPWVKWLVPVIVYLCAIRVIGTTAGGHKRLPALRDLGSEPKAMIVRPLISAAVAGAELYLPFFVVAGILMVAGVTSPPSLVAAVVKSPVMIVIMATLSLLYLPALLTLIASPERGLKDIASPRAVVAVIIAMEMEYLAAIVVIGALAGAWGLVLMRVGGIPVVGRVASVAVGLYALPIIGLVLGRLKSRFDGR